MLLKIDDPKVAHEYLKAGLLVDRSGTNWPAGYNALWPIYHPDFFYLVPSAYIEVEE